MIDMKNASKRIDQHDNDSRDWACPECSNERVAEKIDEHKTKCSVCNGKIMITIEGSAPNDFPCIVCKGNPVDFADGEDCTHCEGLGYDRVAWMKATGQDISVEDTSVDIDMIDTKNFIVLLASMSDVVASINDIDDKTRGVVSATVNGLAGAMKIQNPQDRGSIVADFIMSFAKHLSTIDNDVFDTRMKLFVESITTPKPEEKAESKVASKKK